MDREKRQTRMIKIIEEQSGWKKKRKRTQNASLVREVHIGEAEKGRNDRPDHHLLPQAR